MPPPKMSRPARLLATPHLGGGLLTVLFLLPPYTNWESLVCHVNKMPL